jgi:methylphosphotriester-DNA--protein-cysteine methyltransferase
MADKDVIDRVGAMLETNTRGPYRPANDEAHWKSYYMVVKRGKKAIKLMKRLRPLMGERRRKQIDKALASYTFKEHGDNHPQAKLTADRVREIRRRIAAGEKQTHLAKEFGVDKGLIWQIKARRIWQHVT